jgi:DNA mismatch repair ATPase MutS
MKAHLMYRDRDFDAAPLLTRRDRELRYRRDAGDQSLNLAQALPWNAQALRQDLGLDILFNAMCRDDLFLFETAQVAVLSSLTDLATIRYRQDILEDSFGNERTVREIYQITIDAIEGERRNYWGILARYPAGTLHRAVEVLQMFVVCLKKLRSIADRSAGEFRSEGFRALFAMLQKELDDAYFTLIDEHLLRLKFRQGTLISARLDKGNRGRDYVLRRPHVDKRNWLARLLFDQSPRLTYQLHPRDEAGARALSELNNRGVNLVANALAQSTDHILSFFQMLRTELAFYIGCMSLREALEGIGEPVCMPTPTPAGQRNLSFSGLYDAPLALSMKRKIVANDLETRQTDIFIITGANTGGKSTFLRSVGIAQIMMQAGMFVPAESFSSEVCEGLVTHYKREEDAAMESGKWDEELDRMSQIVDRIKANSVLLLNESFASTNEREGSEIASQIVQALLDSGVKVLFVTHLYHFAHSVFLRWPSRTTFLRAERRADGTRPFKLVEGAPMQTSYGEDLYSIIFAAADSRTVNFTRDGKQ